MEAVRQFWITTSKTVTAVPFSRTPVLSLLSDAALRKTNEVTATPNDGMSRVAISLGDSCLGQFRFNFQMIQIVHAPVSVGVD